MAIFNENIEAIIPVNRIFRITRHIAFDRADYVYVWFTPILCKLTCDLDLF